MGSRHSYCCTFLCLTMGVLPRSQVPPEYLLGTHLAYHTDLDGAGGLHIMNSGERRVWELPPLIVSSNMYTVGQSTE